MKQFNLRVYGILINERQQVLLSDEEHAGVEMTKFPGGGLEWGESLPDGLAREFREETGIDVRVGELFYLTDFFQVSAFHPDHQLISVYYRVYPLDPNDFAQFDQIRTPGETQIRHWKALHELTPDMLTFPIDQLVARKLGELL